MRFPLLALLASGPAHGYELKQALEQRFGSVLPPLNADPLELIDRQRFAYLQALRTLDDVAAQSDGDVTASLLVEGAALHLEADLKWLDLCERRMSDGS